MEKSTKIGGIKSEAKPSPAFSTQTDAPTKNKQRMPPQRPLVLHPNGRTYEK